MTEQPIVVTKGKMQKPSYYAKVNSWFKDFSGYDLKSVSSLDNIIKLLHSPRDGSSLAVARIFYGLAMMIDTVEERAGFELDARWGDDNACQFTLLPFVEPLSLPRMGILYAIMWIGALGICLGYKFTVSCVLYIVPYWYLILLDKSVWNNHSYLFGLMGILFTCSSANKCLSLDSYLQSKQAGCEKKSQNNNNNGQNGNLIESSSSSSSSTQSATMPEHCVPFWNYFIIKFQYYILYTLAGIYKLSPEWLSGYSMSQLNTHWVFTPFRMILGSTWTDLLIIHWFGCIFDLTIAFWLTHKRTRIMSTVFAISFHLMNSRLFTIGMFPWVCLGHLPLFYSVDWPRKLMATGGAGPEKNLSVDVECQSTRMEIKSGHKRTTLLLGVYIFLQLFLPNSHFITRGYNNWTKGLYGYSWNMMVNSWQPILTSIRIVDNQNNTLYLDPHAFTENSRWTRHADMAVQYAKCIQRNMRRGVNEYRGEGDISVENISIYFDVWCSMNSRFQQRVFDPRVDMLTAEWSPFKDPAWVLPILYELSEVRPQLAKISEQVFAWNNYSDVLFIADFPGLSLDNYIAESAENVSLTVLDGTVRVSSADPQESRLPVTLTRGQSVALPRQAFHNVFVVGEDSPASYMYTYTNATMMNVDQEDDTNGPPELLPLWEETKERWNKFQMFFLHVLNALLDEIYGVPMPRRVRTAASVAGADDYYY